MAKNAYFRNIKKEDDIFKLVNALWEVSKVERELEKLKDGIESIAGKIDKGDLLAKWIADALGLYHGDDVDGLRTVWGNWWKLFQTFYNADGSKEYWSEFVSASEEYSGNYSQTEFKDIAYRLAQVGLDYQQERTK